MYNIFIKYCILTIYYIKYKTFVVKCFLNITLIIAISLLSATMYPMSVT